MDEFHNFLTLSFADILAEARKYGLNLVLAHQYLEQLDEKLRAAVFGNVGTIISFRVGVEDAKLLAREFYPTFSETDLANLPNHSIYLKLLIDGKPSAAFSASHLAAPREKSPSCKTGNHRASPGRAMAGPGRRWKRPCPFGPRSHAEQGMISGGCSSRRPARPHLPPDVRT